MQENLKKASQLNEKVENETGKKHVYGITKFSDLTQEEFKGKIDMIKVLYLFDYDYM